MTDITGKTLIGMGFEPAPWFGEVIKEAAVRRLSPSQAARLARSRIDAVEKAEKAEPSARHGKFRCAMRRCPGFSISRLKMRARPKMWRT